MVEGPDQKKRILVRILEHKKGSNNFERIEQGATQKRKKESERERGERESVCVYRRERAIRERILQAVIQGFQKSSGENTNAAAVFQQNEEEFDELKRESKAICC
ncbi:hypothetical protein L6452_33601 [Arctium lappa]|uniref:Uncharacterized protein n=1 Tax=Arctium lappa TaxID=4217 RepID=A0ACB8YGU9_ARCLA|nr:hypothetical protein L6452_33601 [Arctium lappa]